MHNQAIAKKLSTLSQKPLNYKVIDYEERGCDHSYRCCLNIMLVFVNVSRQTKVGYLQNVILAN